MNTNYSLLKLCDAQIKENYSIKTKVTKCKLQGKMALNTTLCSLFCPLSFLSVLSVNAMDGFDISEP